MYKDKARDLRRAPLPSSRFKGARKDKRNARKRSRQNARRAIAEINFDGWDDAEYYDPNDDFTRVTREAVFDRRDGDTLGAIMAWAKSVKDDNPNAAPDELQAKVRAVIGDGFMADHAMSHIELIDGFDLNPDQHRWYRFSSAEVERRRREREAKAAADVARLVEDVCDLWLKGQNRKIRELAYEHISTVEVKGWRFISNTSVKLIFVGRGENRREYERPRWPNGGYWVGIVESYNEIEERVTQWLGSRTDKYTTF